MSGTAVQEAAAEDAAAAAAKTTEAATGAAIGSSIAPTDTSTVNGINVAADTTSDEDGETAQAAQQASEGAPGSSMAATKLPSKKKEALSQVPCKFFRANGCSAGDACPFAHILPGEGQGKAICQWYLKGSCRFGHRCALAHILPGQPMSMDRKNKRAAQQQVQPPNGQPSLLRKGLNGVPQQLQQQHHQSPFAMHQGMYSMQPGMAPNDIPMLGYNGQPLANAQGQFSRPMPLPTSTSREGDFLFGMPDDLQGQYGHAQQGSTPDRRGMPVQDEWKPQQLGLEKARTIDGLAGSPARIAAFGTSPFSRPGSHSVFYSEDTRSNNGEGSFARSLGKSDDGRAGASSGGFQNSSDDMDGRGGEKDNSADDVNGEDFLPSSLSDLLTPAELERRRKGALGTDRKTPLSGAVAQSMPVRGGVPSAGPSLWPWDPPSDDRVQRNSPLRPSNLSSSFRAGSPIPKGATDVLARSPLNPDTAHGYVSRAFPLGASNSSTGFLASRTSVIGQRTDDVWASGQGINETSFDAYSPGVQAAMSHAPGQSLPQGLAAGLSRMHLRAHTDDVARGKNQKSSHLQSRFGLDGGSSAIGTIGERSSMDELGPIAPSSVLDNSRGSLLARANDEAEGTGSFTSQSASGASHKSKEISMSRANGDARLEKGTPTSDKDVSHSVNQADKRHLSAPDTIKKASHKAASSPLALPARGGEEVEEAIFELE